MRQGPRVLLWPKRHEVHGHVAVTLPFPDIAKKHPHPRARAHTRTHERVQTQVGARTVDVMVLTGAGGSGAAGGGGGACGPGIMWCMAKWCCAAR